MTMKKKTMRHRPASRTIEEIRANFEAMADGYQDLWIEEVLSDAPRWGHVLGLHLRICELEHLEEAGLELLQ
jgi:hypothetical protein